MRYKNEDELADEAKVWLCSLRFLHNIPNIKPQFLRLEDLGGKKKHDWWDYMEISIKFPASTWQIQIQFTHSET